MTHRVALAQVLESFETGKRPKGGAVDSGVPSLGGEHVTAEGTLKLDPMRFVPDKFYQSMIKGRLQVGDVLVVKDGATTGRVGMIEPAFPFEQAGVNEHLFLLRADARRLDARYLYFYLRSTQGQAEVMSDFRGAAQGGISREIGTKVRVPLLSLDAQRRIVDLLSRAEGIVRLRREAQKKATEIIPALFVDMFGDPQSARQTHKIVALGDLCHKIVDGTHKTPNYVPSGVPFVTVKNIVTGQLDLTETKFISEQDHLELIKRANPKRGDILVSKDGTIGVPCLLQADDVFSIFVSVALLKPNHELIDSAFLASQFNTQGVQQQISDGTKGVAIRHLHLRDFRTLRFIVPPMELQKAFARRLSEFRDIERLQAAAVANARAAFDALLAKVFAENEQQDTRESEVTTVVA